MHKHRLCPGVCAVSPILRNHVGSEPGADNNRSKVWSRHNMISTPRQSNFGPNSRGRFNGTGCGRNWRRARVTSPRPVYYMTATRGAQVIPNYKLKHDTAYAGIRVPGHVCGNYAPAELDFDSTHTRLLFASPAIRWLTDAPSLRG